ncbi:MAG TPA: dihydrofolate reductase [Candidatus Nanoarchaeia archaeon]|nr:dihydrofolate reductase [Candidatus Nanoarchaeia archaeon]
MRASISISVAYDRKGHIGYQGDLPWRGQLPADMERFKQLTMGHVVIMGRKTYESLPAKFRPLPGRQNWVITSHWIDGPGLVQMSNPEYVLENLWSGDGEELFVIGGARVYDFFLPAAQRVYATQIYAEFAGDVIFPTLGEDEWLIAEQSQVFQPDGKNLHPYQFVVYERRSDA